MTTRPTTEHQMIRHPAAIPEWLPAPARRLWEGVNASAVVQAVDAVAWCALRGNAETEIERQPRQLAKALFETVLEYGRTEMSERSGRSVDILAPLAPFAGIEIPDEWRRGAFGAATVRLAELYAGPGCQVRLTPSVQSRGLLGVAANGEAVVWLELGYYRRQVRACLREFCRAAFLAARGDLAHNPARGLQNVQIAKDEDGWAGLLGFSEERDLP